MIARAVRGSGQDGFFAHRPGGGTVDFLLDYGANEALDDLISVPSE